MHDPAERFNTVPAGPARAKLLELLVRGLTVAVTVVAPVVRSTRSHAGFLVDEVRRRTGGSRADEAVIAAARRELDPVDEHAATVVRELRPRSLPPPLTDHGVLTGPELDEVVRRLVAVGRPASLRREFGAWGRVPDEEVMAGVDEGRMRSAHQVLESERVELVRRSS